MKKTVSILFIITILLLTISCDENIKNMNSPDSIPGLSFVVNSPISARGIYLGESDTDEELAYKLLLSFSPVFTGFNGDIETQGNDEVTFTVPALNTDLIVNAKILEDRIEYEGKNVAITEGDNVIVREGDSIYFKITYYSDKKTFDIYQLISAWEGNEEYKIPFVTRIQGKDIKVDESGNYEGTSINADDVTHNSYDQMPSIIYSNEDIMLSILLTGPSKRALNEKEEVSIDDSNILSDSYFENLIKERENFSLHVQLDFYGIIYYEKTTNNFKLYNTHDKDTYEEKKEALIQKASELTNNDLDITPLLEEFSN